MMEHSADNTTIDSLPKGFIPVMLTPFLSDGTIDYHGLAKLTEFYIEAGVAGLFANCLSSEMFELTEDERVEMTQFIVDQVNGRIPVVATGTFGGPIEQQAEFVKRIYATGLQAVIAITCMLAEEGESDDIFLGNTRQLIALTDNIPLGLYECPVPYKRVISSEILAELLPTGRIVYHKDTCLDDVEVARRLAVGEGYKFGLYDAYMVNAVSSLRAGAAGLSCIQGNMFPELVVFLCNHFNDESKRKELALVQDFFTECMDLVHTAYPTIAKYTLQERGLPISLYTRRAIDPLTAELKSEMSALIEKADKLYEEIQVEKLMAI
jgi:4-hydroxy-tetrahydrodipicolinate synthase